MAFVNMKWTKKHQNIKLLCCNNGWFLLNKRVLNGRNKGIRNWEGFWMDEMQKPPRLRRFSCWRNAGYLALSALIIAANADNCSGDSLLNNASVLSFLMASSNFRALAPVLSLMAHSPLSIAA